jgi:uncharacterized protein
MNVYLVCSGVLVVVYFLLANHVSYMRVQTNVVIGNDDLPSGRLNRAIRAHGNASEYIPLFVALFLYFLVSGASGWISWVVVGVTICRVLHPIAIFIAPDLNQRHFLRFIAAVGTYLGGIALGVALLLRAFVA